MPNLPPLPWLDEASFRRELEANYFTRDRPELTAKPLVALSGLYDVPWGSLSEAYGPAHFVPYFIEALSSPDADDRQWGLEALHASINHQGHPEEASLHAVPFLLELLRAPELPDTAMVLALVTEMAVGDSRWCCEAGTDVDRFHRSICYTEVARSASSFVELLTQSDPAVRAGAARACALLEQCSATSEPILARMAVEDRDEGVRLVARVALGVVARRTGTDVADQLRAFSRSADDWERASALAGLAYALGDRIEPEELRDLDRLGRELPAPFDSEPAPSDRLWREIPPNLAWDLGTTLRAQFVTASVPSTLESKLLRIEGPIDGVAIECAKRALAELLPAADGEPLLLHEMSALLRRLLRTLAGDAQLYRRVFGYSSEAPPRLPLASGHVQRVLGIGTGPLDRVLAFDSGTEWPVWRSLYAVIAGELDEPAWLRAVESALTPAERLQLVVDAVKNIHWYTGLGRLRALEWRQKNDAESRVLILLARSIAGTESGVSWASDQAAHLLSSNRQRVLEELLVALTLAMAARNRGEWLERRYEPLLNLDHAPASVYARALAQAATALEPARREALVASLPLARYSSTSQTSTDPRTGEVSRRIECRYIHFPPFWEMLPPLAGPAAVRRVLETAIEDQAHRREHADRPERLMLRGSKDEDFPRRLAQDTFEKAGAAARPVLEAYRDKLEDPSLIDEALSRAR